MPPLSTLEQWHMNSQRLDELVHACQTTAANLLRRLTVHAATTQPTTPSDHPHELGETENGDKPPSPPTTPRRTHTGGKDRMKPPGGRGCLPEACDEKKLAGDGGGGAEQNREPPPPPPPTPTPTRRTALDRMPSASENTPGNAGEKDMRAALPRDTLRRPRLAEKIPAVERLLAAPEDLPGNGGGKQQPAPPPITTTPALTSLLAAPVSLTELAKTYHVSPQNLTRILSAWGDTRIPQGRTEWEFTRGAVVEILQKRIRRGMRRSQLVERIVDGEMRVLAKELGVGVVRLEGLMGLWGKKREVAIDGVGGGFSSGAGDQNSGEAGVAVGGGNVGADGVAAGENGYQAVQSVVGDENIGPYAATDEFELVQGVFGEGGNVRPDGAAVGENGYQAVQSIVGEDNSGPYAAAGENGYQAVQNVVDEENSGPYAAADDDRWATDVNYWSPWMDRDGDARGAGHAFQQSTTGDGVEWLDFEKAAIVENTILGAVVEGGMESVSI